MATSHSAVEYSTQLRSRYLNKVKRQQEGSQQRQTQIRRDREVEL